MPYSRQALEPRPPNPGVKPMAKPITPTHMHSTTTFIQYSVIKWLNVTPKKTANMDNVTTCRRWDRRCCSILFDSALFSTSRLRTQAVTINNPSLAMFYTDLSIPAFCLRDAERARAILPRLPWSFVCSSAMGSVSDLSDTSDSSDLPGTLCAATPYAPIPSLPPA